MTTTRSIWAAGAVALAVGCAQSPATQARSGHGERFAVSGTPQKLGFFSAVNPDCTTKGIPVLRVTRTTVHGSASISEDAGYPEFPAASPYYHCNRQRTQGVAISYTSNAGYIGDDTVSVEIIFPGGGYKTFDYSIIVK
jgi:hypothetical protein